MLVTQGKFRPADSSRTEFALALAGRRGRWRLAAQARLGPFGGVGAGGGALEDLVERRRGGPAIAAGEQGKTAFQESIGIVGRDRERPVGIGQRLVGIGGMAPG